MSDYSRQYDFSVKDALPVGDANKKIKGSEVDDEFDAIVTSNNTKANKVVTPTDGAYLVQDSNGDLADGGVVISSFIDTVLDDADAATAKVTLDVQTGANGTLKAPSGTTAQRAASIGIRYNTDLATWEGYNGASWGNIGGGALGGGADNAFYENDKATSGSGDGDYTVTTDKNAMTAGPFTITSGDTITVPSGSTWTIV